MQRLSKAIVATENLCPVRVLQGVYDAREGRFIGFWDSALVSCSISGEANHSAYSNAWLQHRLRLQIKSHLTVRSMAVYVRRTSSYTSTHF